MKLSKLFFALVFIALSFNAVAQKLADPILLWPDGAPGATTIRAGDHEGVLVAQWLKAHGITAFMLRYRLRPLYGRNDWMADGQRAMQYIRAHAAEYHISADRVGAVGFSAGSTLLADMTLNNTPAQPNATDPLSRLSSKPNFLILCYGSVRIPANADSAAVAAMPPTFLFGTVEDRGSQSGMLDMYTRLYRAGAPVEAHFFRNGIHGTGFGLGDPVLGQWTTLLHNWMTAGGFLTPKPQVPLAGVVKLNGSPLLAGMVILTPVDNKNAPPVIVYIRNTGTDELGRFLMPKSQGPVEGKYKVEVRQDATRWTSNSREPFMIKMMDKQSKGTLTDADKKEWGEYQRKRDLSPSIDNQHIFPRKHPNDKQDYIIDIKAGKEVMIDVFSK
jgi:predicted esterase